MKIAIFGGSFNPVHTEHVNIVRAAVSALNLDRVSRTYVFADVAENLRPCVEANLKIFKRRFNTFAVRPGAQRICKKISV